MGRGLLKTTLKISSAALVLAVLGAGVNPAFAQDSGASKDDSNAADIVVTATRRDQSIQDVALTLQAFGTETLSKLNVSTINDLLKYTPNVTFSNNGPGQGAIFMRGLSAGFAGQQSSATIGGFPNVALYLDDQSMQFPARNADVYMADMERVEVLEGPQGTLFGGGAQAGVVRYITNKPKLDRFEGRIEGSFGGTVGGASNGSFNGTVNVPIIEDKLAIRAVVYADHRGGYIDNKYSTFTRQPTDLGSYYLAYNGNGNRLTPAQQSRSGKYDNAALVEDNFNPVDYTGGRLSLAWQATPDWDVLVTQSYQKLESKGTFAVQGYTYDYAPLTGLSSTLFAPQYNKDDYSNTSWTVNGKLGDFKLIYTGAYLTRHISQQGDYTNYSRATYGIFYQCTGAGNYYWGTYGGAPYCYEPTGYWKDKVRNTHQSHEVRISTPDTGRIRAIAGAYYENFAIEDNMDWSYKTIPVCDQQLTAAQIKASGAVCMGLVAPNPAATLNLAGPRGPAVAFGQDIQRGYKQYAAFGSVDFDITPNLTITAGTRYYYYDNYQKGSVYSSFSASCYQVPVCVTGSNLDTLGLKSTYKGFKSKGTITWKPKDGTMLYATFSEGFRPGAFNRGPSARVADPVAPHAKQLLVPAAYAPDNLTNYEAGLKTDLMNGKMTFNLSAYFMEWKNIQIGFFNPAAGFGNTAFATNGPTYHIKGLEAQVYVKPADGLTIQGSATYNSSKQANSPCFIANNPGVSTFGKCITQVWSGGAVKSVQSPFGTVGSTTPFSPKFQGNVRVRYDWDGAGENKYFAAVGMNYTSSQFNEPATYPSGDVPGNGNVVGPNGIIVPATTVLRYKMPGYALADAQIGFSRDNWTVTLFGDNIFNSHASTFTNSSQYIKTSTIVRPMTYGIKISTKL
ncbi:MAG: TonB-dependent receptor [Alphaproteobacteria bacterium]|nr:TonB-dependent receptor [Alphaproteobacteria bacterium]